MHCCQNDATVKIDEQLTRRGHQKWKKRTPAGKVCGTRTPHGRSSRSQRCSQRGGSRHFWRTRNSKRAAAAGRLTSTAYPCPTCARRSGATTHARGSAFGQDSTACRYQRHLHLTNQTPHVRREEHSGNRYLYHRQTLIEQRVQRVDLYCLSSVQRSAVSPNHCLEQKTGLWSGAICAAPEKRSLSAIRPKSDCQEAGAPRRRSWCFVDEVPSMVASCDREVVSSTLANRGARKKRCGPRKQRQVGCQTSLDKEDVQQETNTTEQLPPRRTDLGALQQRRSSV